MFETGNTTGRIDNNSYVKNDGATVMLNPSTSTYNRIKTFIAAIVIMATALFSAAAPASADGGFTPDGVNFIPAPGPGQVVATFTPDGVNQVENVGATIARPQVLAYLNGGNHSPDGVSNLQSNGQVSPVIAMWTPDGVNQVENVEATIARPQVLAYLNGGNHSPDGVSNLQDAEKSSPVIAMWTPDGVNQIEVPEVQIVDAPSVPTLAYYYAQNTNPSQVG
jgi:hypothetical protein